ncbi:MAG: sialidase family protein [Bacteroidales bacterium]
MNTVKPLILIIMLITAASCNRHPGFRAGILMEEFVYEEAPFPSCHASTIAETPAGLVTAFFGGTYERHPDVCIYVSRRSDAGWSIPEEVANGIISDTLRYPTWNPVLYQVPGGELLLFYKVGPSPSEWWGMLKRSTDGGLTWSDAEALPDGYIGPVKNKPVLLEGGTLICPTSTEDQGWRIHFEYTPDHGKTWSRSEPINTPRVYQAIQPSILFHTDGRLQILARTLNSVLVTSWSEDQGKSWTLLQESGLPNNNSGTDAVTLADGRQLVVYNHVRTPVGARGGYRTPLNVSVSEDGLQWKAALVLEDSEIGEYSYPAVIQASDGMVHVVYTWRRERIKHVVIDPGQLKTRPIVNGQWPG